MTTVYVVPCGISVLDQLARKMPAGGSPVARFTRVIGNGAWLNGVDLDSDEAVPVAWSHITPLAKEAGLGDAVPKWLSAETHTLATSVIHNRLAPGQNVLLLASDTKMGLTAAFCVAQYLTGFGSDPVGYTTSPPERSDKWDLNVTQAPVTVIRVRGLTPVGTNFNLAAFGIGKTLRAAADSGGDVQVHLTGGFKATLLHTLAVTEILHSMAVDRVSAWNVFEDDPDSTSDDPASPGRVGLRTYLPEYLELMRTELSGACDGEKLGTTTFENICWTEDSDGSRRLNDFGHGYLAVLGHSAWPRGDDNS